MLRTTNAPNITPTRRYLFTTGRTMIRRMAGSECFGKSQQPLLPLPSSDRLQQRALCQRVAIVVDEMSQSA